MRIIVSGNLNTFGNNGYFETDPSTWGFSSDWGNVTRNSYLSQQGLYHFFLEATTVPDPGDYSAGLVHVAFGKLNAVTGKKYLVSIYYRGSGTAAFVDPDTDAIIMPETTTYDGTWTRYEAPYIPAVGGIKYLRVAEMTLLGTEVELDRFEIFEYIDVVPTCTLAIDVPGTTVSDETGVGTNDGVINIAHTGGTGTLEYSKDNGSTWQLSSMFTGLSSGVYQCKVREVATISCVSSQSFAVNASAYTFSFTDAVTDESILGAHDGVIALTVTGTVAPFTFSKDGGVTYQSGNVFSGLAPGTYSIVVKDNGGITRARNITVDAGEAVFENVFFSKNHIPYLSSAASGWEAEINYRLYDDVRIEEVAGSALFVSAIKVELPPDTDGNVTFQVRQAFRKLKAVPPTLNRSTFERLTDRIKYFKHYIGELTGVEVVPASLTESLPQLVMLGGISKFKFPGFNYFTSYLPTNKKFMTWAPLVKRVARLQEDYLNFWVYNASMSALKLNLKVYFDDDTNETDQPQIQSAVSYGELYRVPAGPVNSGALLVNPAKNALYYELWLTDNSDAVVSEVRTYQIEEYTRPNLRLFMFLNSLGAEEVLAFYGQASVTTETNRSVIGKFLPVGYSALDGEKEVNEVSLTNQYDLSTGFFKGSNAKEWTAYMRDFLLSKRVFEVTSGARKPVIITDGSVNEIDQNYSNYYLRFKVEEAYTNTVYTPDSV